VLEVRAGWWEGLPARLKTAASHRDSLPPVQKAPEAAPRLDACARQGESESARPPQHPAHFRHPRARLGRGSGVGRYALRAASACRPGRLVVREDPDLCAVLAPSLRRREVPQVKLGDPMLIFSAIQRPSSGSIRPPPPEMHSVDITVWPSSDGENGATKSRTAPAPGAWAMRPAVTSLSGRPGTVSVTSVGKLGAAAARRKC
jgi:hypothetical protein